MKNQNTLKKIVLWMARITGSLVVAFVMFFLLAHLFESNGSDGAALLSIQDAITFIFFPVSTIIGISVALKWAGAGGLITLLGLIGLLIIRPDLISNLLLMGIMLGPALLFLIYWYLSKKLSSGDY